ncbi:hypothetical protein SAMN03097708_01438 [Thiohalomonas denitrificans]|uniref:Uncharacterized protein n=1 Tax=Thiohalomonas denitrificans TaxID=415747 RepID=A0A1G5Q890_9GAMM|nr:hypothetical protein SAMN03097708_01438 [Thiohalomonas denitrificans]
MPQSIYSHLLTVFSNIIRGPNSFIVSYGKRHFEQVQSFGLFMAVDRIGLIYPLAGFVLANFFKKFGVKTSKALYERYTGFVPVIAFVSHLVTRSWG